MILVTRLTGAAFAVNPDLLERVEATPDTVLTLIDGTKYLVAESVTDVIELVRDYRASVVASARAHREGPPAPPVPQTPELHVVPRLRVASLPGDDHARPRSTRPQEV